MVTERQVADIVRQTVEERFAPEHRAAVLAEFGTMSDDGQWPLAQIQLALIGLSGGDPQFIVTGQYRKSDWRDLVHTHQLLGKERHLRALDITAIMVMLEREATRLDALSALEAKGSEALPTIPRLIELLQEGDQLFVAKVLRTLEAIGPIARGAVPALLQLGADEDPLIRHHARRTLKAIDPGAAVQSSGHGK